MGIFDGFGDFVTDVFGSDNEYHAVAPEIDPNAYQYGGAPGGADEAARRYQDQANRAQGRQGSGEIGAQRTLADAMSSRALGKVPSIAQMQADRQMGQATAAQASMAASARGAGGLALAQQNAANNLANMQGAISNQAQINAAQERMAAEQAAFGARSSMRGQDIQQNALNDQMTLGMTGYEQGVRNSQLAASMNQQAQQSANAMGAQGINAGVAGQNAATNQANAMGVIGLGAGIASGGLVGKADGGPISGGTPYLVGERGPELVVPATDGMVIPNEQLPPTGIARATWGLGGPDVDGQTRAALRAQNLAEIARSNATEAANTESPWDRTVRRYRALQQAAPDLVTDEDREEARRSMNVVRNARGLAGMRSEDSDDKEKTSGDKQKAAPKRTLASAIKSAGDSAMNFASNVDIGYHGPQGGYAPPQLIPLRADGGPVTGGMPFIGGEMGPELVIPSLNRSMPGATVSAGPTGQMSGGGMNVLGSLMTHGAASTGFRGQPRSGGMTYGGPRESGGPVGAGKSYLVGERGPEMVLPLYEPPGKQRMAGRAVSALARMRQ